MNLKNKAHSASEELKVRVVGHIVTHRERVDKRKVKGKNALTNARYAAKQTHKAKEAAATTAKEASNPASDD